MRAFLKQWSILAVIAVLILSSAISAQDEGPRFKKEELAQMLAPIALYPDSLITDILMASTYPLEIVKAERWMRENKELKGDALDTALQGQSWDSSIKVLCHFPDLLFSMSDKLDQTRKLGDAFLSQQDDVMATIQELRRKADEQGNLRTTKEQTVTKEGDAIKIEPTDPQVVYVPVYDPYYVYGPWWYPAYPPYYWHYPSGVVITGGYMGFGAGFFVGVDLFPWFWPDWHRHVIHIDHNRIRRFERFEPRREFDRPFWRHDPDHRHGVAYGNRRTNERFGGRTFQTPQPTFEDRGFPRTRPKGGTVAPPHAPEPQHPGRTFGGTAVSPPQTGTFQHKEGTVPRTRSFPTGERRDTPFSGIGEGRFERRAIERGEKSHQREEGKRKGDGAEKRGKGNGGGRGFQKR